MSETSDLPPDSAPSEDQAPPFAPIRIAGQYIKDLSFEVPGAPEIYSILQTQAPEIPISIDVVARPVGDREQHPVGRVGTPEDISALVAYLLSDEAGFVTGQDVIVDGGMTRKMIYA